MSSTYLVISLVVLLVVVVAGGFVRRRAAAVRAADLMQQLRMQALEATPEDSSSGPFTLVMDIPYPQAVASLVATSAGDASIYLSSGGGVIGGVQHNNVRSAAVVLLQEATRHLDKFVHTAEYPYPPVGKVRFYIRSSEGVAFAEADEQDLQEGKSPLTSLYIAGQNVITELRLASQGRESVAG